MESKPTQPISVNGHALFRGHADAWKQIAPHIRNKSFAKDDVVLHHGDPANALWLVAKGWVKLSRQTPDGKETIVGLCTTGDVFGEAALFPQASYPYHAEVLTADTELAAIPSDVIRRIINSDAALSNSIMSLLNERVGQTQLKLEHMSTMTTAQRLGCFLLRLCDHHTNSGQFLQIPVEKHLLATFLGMKPETFSRSQQQLKSIGVDVSGSQVNVSSVSKLREFVCNSCSESGSCETEQ
jgi:CRP-like cAMP-binding protein